MDLDRKYGLARASTGFLSASAAIFVLLVIGTHQAFAHDRELIPDLVDRVLPAVASITVTQPQSDKGSAPPKTEPPNVPEGSPFEEFFEEHFGKEQGDSQSAETGESDTNVSNVTGFVIDPSGLIVTLDQAIASASEITVALHGGSELPATLVGSDSVTGLALLRISSSRPLDVVQFGDSDKLRVGEEIIVIGSPFGLANSVTKGIVSAKNRDINAGPYDAFIQTDAAINRGNSGGPMFNLDGEVVGVSASIISSSGESAGVGFVVPSSIARNVVQQLRDYGQVRRGLLGVRIQEMNAEIAATLGLDHAAGALVAEVVPDGPAASAGIENGDVLLTFAGRQIATMKDVPRFVAETPPGTSVGIEVLRHGQRLSKTVTLGRLEETGNQPSVANEDRRSSTGEYDALSFLGMRVEQLDPRTRAKYGIPEKIVSGAVVTSVAEGSEISDKGVTEGDVIVEISQEKIATLDDIVRQIERLKRDNRQSALLMVSNAEGDLRFIALALGNAEITKASSKPEDAGSLPTVREVQQALAELGLDPGPIDGTMGQRTREAIVRFQTENGLVADGRITRELGAALQQLAAAQSTPTTTDNGETQSESKQTEGLGSLD